MGRGPWRAAVRAAAAAPEFECPKHPGTPFVSYIDDVHRKRRPAVRWACPICLEAFRAFCREINVRPKDRPLFY